ncbi:MAG: choline dehydrogenase, partial [Alphaproteobacteria bacterium]|nr:choline dehydrogenase [Alphaproteobacteria bacterium]
IAGERYQGEATEWRGKTGRLGVKQANYPDPLYDAFLAAGLESGQGRSDDLNGANPEGLARLDCTVMNGKRCSAATAHLKPALARENLTLLPFAETQQVILNGNKAQGVVFTNRGERITAFAEREVILCGGAINSPKLLMLSGIGPEQHLKECNITPRMHLPGVGQNLQDHAKIRLQFASKKRLPFHSINNPFNKLKAGINWMLTGGGMAGSNIWEAGGLIRSNEDVSHPNLQYHFGPLGFTMSNGKIKVEQAFSLNVDQMRPKSTGEIRLNPSDPQSSPMINFRYMHDPYDLKEMVEAVSMARDLVSQQAFDEFRGVEMKPGSQYQSVEDIEGMLRANIETAYHPSCTCRMGYD